jgi:DNA gyrase subunit A
MDIGTVNQVDIDTQMRDAYLDYAMSVIVARALPDARDGLKPVHRRILYAMDDLSLRANSPYKKSARIVGDVLGKYHPHGDAAVYETKARKAQDFSMSYLLGRRAGQLRLGDGDAPAAMRYTEARLHHLAEEMLADLGQEHCRLQPQFRRFAAGADRPACPASKPVAQRGRRACGGYGDEHTAAQPARDF